jgi:hypothetical protein
MVYVVYSLVARLIIRNWPERAKWVAFAAPFEDKDKGSNLTLSFADRRNLKSSEMLLADRLDVINGIHRRVERLVLRSQVILYTIGLALVASAIVILFAGRLTSIDASAVSNVDRLKSDLSDEVRKLSKLYQLKNAYSQQEAAANLSLSRDQLDKLDRQISSLRDDSSPGDSTSTTVVIAREELQADKIRTLLQEAWEKELDSQQGYSDWHYIAATAITRVGIVLIIVYLVQILMGLYRYNTRLIAYYNSRRDLLTLWDGKQRSLKSLDEILTSSKIDFGKEPKHPLEDLIHALGGKMNTYVSGRPPKVPTNPTGNRASG